MREVWRGRKKIGLTISLMSGRIQLSSLQGPLVEEVVVGERASSSRIAEYIYIYVCVCFRWFYIYEKKEGSLGGCFHRRG